MVVLKRFLTDQRGFTLIEMISVLILVGIMAAIAGMGVVVGIQGYVFTKDTAAISEKANLAIARLGRELLECYNCSGTSGSAVQNPVINPLGNRYFRLNSGNIEISGDNFSTHDIMINNIDSFTLQYTDDGNIRLNMTVNNPYSATPLTFSTQVHPRNTN